MYWCRTLGELALYADVSEARPLLRTPKTLLILAYVGLRPQRTACRDQLSELFWPGTPLTQARHALRQSLYRLRQAAGDGPLIELNDAIVRCADNVRFDCLEVEDALAAQDWEQVWALMRGPFLEAVKAPKSKELEDWMESERSRFREHEFRVGEAVIELAFAQKRPADAVTVAERLKATDPAEERRIRVLMNVLDRCGQAPRALAEYRSFAALVSNGFDDEPTADLQAYARDLERSLEYPVDESVATIPFVGRSSAWAKILDRWSKTETGGSGLLLIEGDLGLGKTRLIEEFATRALAAGALWLSGKCYEIEQTLPFALIADLTHSPRRRDRPQAGDQPPSEPDLFEPPDLLAISHSRPLEGNGTHEPNGSLPLYTGVAEWLTRLTADHPLLITCDDIHWADAASLQLLHWLSHRLRGAPLLMLCSYRPAELSPDARRFAGSIASEGLGELVTLDPLTATDVREILCNLGRFQDAALAERLANDLREHTGGNPLFIAELLEALQRADVLALEADEWKPASSLLHEQLPGRLRNILSDKIDSLSHDPRFLLEVMAVVADAVEADAVAPVIGRSAPATEAMLAELRKARLVRSRPFGRYEVAHDELRHVVYASIPDDRRRDIHGKVGRALEAWGEALRPGGAARLAHHFEQAGQTVQARNNALAAAREAGSVGATESQASFLRLAEAFGASSDGPNEDSAPAIPATRSRRSRWLASAALVMAAIATAFIVNGRGDRGASAKAALHPWHQGTLYLIEWQRLQDGTPVETFFRLNWPASTGERAEIIPVEHRPPELPPPLLERVVDSDGERHGKIYRVEGRDTIRLTWGRTDDAQAIWSPDRRLIALHKGWRAGDDYVYNLFVIDTAGGEVWRLTDGPHQDDPLDWSPDGSRIAFRRNTAGRYSLWVADADGLRQMMLSEIGDSGVIPMYAKFSPDSRRLAAHESGSSLMIIDLERRLVQRIPVGCRLVSSRLDWSPDGRWLLAACASAGTRTLMAISTTGQGGPFPIVTLPSPAWDLSHWSSDRPGPVAMVRIRPKPIVLRSGEGKTIVAEASDNAGRQQRTLLRWATTDSSIAAVDDHGFIRGRRAGLARLVASAGGFRADTADVQVIRAPVDTLLHETWESGIDGTRWKIVGEPAPKTVTGAGPDAGAALLSNGDDNWPSGVITRREFDLSEGLTVEFPAYLEFTGEHWQELEASIVPLSQALTPGDERAPGTSLIHWTVIGQSPTISEPIYACHDGQGHGTGSQNWSAASASPAWYHVALQIRPDGYLECYLDGERLGAFAISEPLQSDNAAVFVGGRTNRTRIYHGPLLVTRGLRY